MKILVIDTTSNKEVVVGLKIDGEKFEVREEVGVRRSQVVLPMMVKLLEEHGLTLQQIYAIEVAVGPGSFTGVRVGVSIANALGYALNIPVNGGREVVEAKY